MSLNLVTKVATLKHDAIGERRCGHCRFWHNPDGEPMGICIKETPTPLLVGHQPIAAPVIMDPKAAAQMQSAIPIVLGFHPPRTPEQGCSKFERRLSDVH
jgi:hypothetical protein